MPVTPLQRKKINQEIATARSTLAQKVLQITLAQKGKLNSGVYQLAIDDVSAALRELFQREGVEVK